MESQSSNVSKMEEFSKMLMRKFRTLKYEHVNLPTDYTKTEGQYKALRQALCDFEGNVIKNLLNYEHGNKIYKNLKKGIQFINDKASLGIYQSKDIYEEAASLGEEVKDISTDSKYTTMGKKYTEIFGTISKSKKAMNSRMGQSKTKVKDMKGKIQNIDASRKRVKNTRYDLELMFRDSGYNNEIRDSQKKEFDAAVSNCTKAMKKFIEENELPQIMKEVSLEYKKHLEETLDALRFIG
ncbi:hypothetical protein PAEPH01_0964 [Pancytospora epiphaga]|nr:hypothetical protein PAEPH01_0964 [Pancytospora epiphaga]